MAQSSCETASLSHCRSCLLSPQNISVLTEIFRLLTYTVGLNARGLPFTSPTWGSPGNVCNGIVSSMQQLRSKNGSTSKHLFWCFSLSQMWDFSVPRRTMMEYWGPDGPQYSYHGAFRYCLVLPGTDASLLFVTS